MKRNDIDSMQINNLNLVLSEKKSLFGNLSFNIPANRVVWIRGEPGAGKSTLLRVFSGLVLPTSGEYLINHEIVSKMSFEEFLPYRCNIGYGFDYGGLINNRTILENLSLIH
ncbi:MAG: ATP-binding cassette domain-containing protein, partial [Bdellovibrionales bacterium]